MSFFSFDEQQLTCVLSVETTCLHILADLLKVHRASCFWPFTFVLYCFCHFSLYPSEPSAALSPSASISAHFCRLISDYKANSAAVCWRRGLSSDCNAWASTQTFDCFCSCVPNCNFTWSWLIFELSVFSCSRCSLVHYDKLHFGAVLLLLLLTTVQLQFMTIAD